MPAWLLFTLIQCGLWPLRGVHFSVQLTVAVFSELDALRREGVLAVFCGVALFFFFIDLVDVLVFAVFLLLAFSAGVPLLFFAVFVELFFFLRSDAFARCVFCTAEAGACSEALANGVKDNVVNNKAQSVIEAFGIRATEHSPVRAGILLCLRMI